MHLDVNIKTFWTDVKKWREERQLLLFKNCIKELNDVEIVQLGRQSNSEPDGYFVLNGKTIAIELTDIYVDNDKKAQESLANYITFVTEHKYKKTNANSVHVSVNYASNCYSLSEYKLNSSDKIKIPDYLVEKISCLVQTLESNEFRIWYYDELGSDFLENKINDLSIKYGDKVKETFWTCNNTFSSEALETEVIEKYITKKNQKVQKLSDKYDSSWLVLCTEWSMGSNWFVIENHMDFFLKKFKSEYQRVFLLEYFSGRVTELNVI